MKPWLTVLGLVLLLGLIPTRLAVAEQLSNTPVTINYQAPIKLAHHGYYRHRHYNRRYRYRRYRDDYWGWAAAAGAVAAAAAASNRGRVYRCRVWYRGAYRYGRFHRGGPCTVRYRGGWRSFGHFERY